MSDLLTILKQLIADLDAQASLCEGPSGVATAAGAAPIRSPLKGLDKSPEGLVCRSQGRNPKMNTRQEPQKSSRPQRLQPPEPQTLDPDSGWQIVDPDKGWKYVEPSEMWKNIMLDKTNGTDAPDGNNDN